MGREGLGVRGGSRRPAALGVAAAAAPRPPSPTAPPRRCRPPPPSPHSIPVRRLRVAASSPTDRVAESIVFDLTHYGAAEVSAAREEAVANMARALVLARGALLKRGFELGVLPSIERSAPLRAKGAGAGKAKVRRGAAAAAAAAVSLRPAPRIPPPAHPAVLLTPLPAPASNSQGTLVVVNRLVATDLPPVSIILPDSFGRAGRAIARARQTLTEKVRRGGGGGATARAGPALLAAAGRGQQCAVRQLQA
jgi:stage V sporulation protein SpoVS